MTGLAMVVHLISVSAREVIGRAFAKFVGSLRPTWWWAARGLALALLVSLSIPGDGGFTRRAESRTLQMTPEAFFGQDDVPGEVLIGELFTFKVRFKNTGSSIGYAPFIDLAMDARGADYNAADPLANPSVPLPCDGIEFVSASMVDVNGGPLTLTSLTDWNAAACVNGSLPSSVAHPYGNTAGPVNLVSDGWQLVTMALPFGSFDPSQPEVVVEVTARMHDYADISPLLPPHPLKIYARGGFRSATALPGTPMVQFGNTPHLDGWADATIEPTVLTVQKTYSGPEDEAVAGPNFITYYPLKYTIVVDIAEGHTIHNLHVTDILPAQVQFAGNVLVTVLGAQAGPVTQCGGMSPGFPVLITTPSTSTPGGTLDVTLCDPITGQPLMTDEVVIEFEFYIPGAVLDADCDPSPVTVTNDVAARGDWDPSDPRDAPPNTTVPVFSDLTQDDHVLSAKCLAIQKSVEAPPGGPRPGDVLKYTLKFQISDYHTIGQLLVTDVLGDGQDFLTAPPATLRVTDQFGTSGGPASPPSIAFPPGTVSITPDVNAAAQRCGPELQQPPGGTILEFNVSGAMALVTQSPPGIPRHSAGILTGGYAALPVPTAPLTTAAEGEIIFYAQIRDLYAFPVGPGNPVVDKHDPINNCVEISGDVLANTLATTVPSSQVIGLAEDDSSTQTAIVTDILKKSVYAIRRGTSTVCGPTGPACASPPSAPSVLPDDQVTFRLEYSIPAGDAENVVLNDWLPLPFFEVGDPDADGTPGPVWSPVPATPLLLCPGGLPAPGVACELPTNTLLSGANPFTFMPDFATNSLNFNYFSFNNTANTPLTIDVLFTLTVTNTPYADGLHVTNEVQECESNTFGLRLCQTAIAPMVVREPVLAIRKGVVATSNANGVFSPPLTPNVWLPYGAACPRFNTSTPISSLTLQGFGSDLSNVDASDWVTFAIVIENTGGAPAYHISLKDMIPEDVLLQPTCFEPNWGGLCVHYGNGAAIPFTTTGPLPGTGGGRGITFDPSAPLLPGSPLNTAGTNIAIITFNAQMLDKDTLLSGCCDNKAELISYTSTFQGPGPGMPPNFVGAGLGGPFVDTAKVCVGPTAVLKCVQTTSEIHTMQQSGSTVDAAIGEIVRFRLVTAIPEGTTQGFKVTDLLPPGLTYLPNTASVRFVANSPVTSSAMAWPTTANQQFATCGPAMPFNNVAVGGGPFQWGSGTDPIFFLLGTTPYTIKNNDPPSDADLEYAVVEFSAQVDNIPGNVAGLSLTDRFQVDYKDAAGNPNPPSLSAPADVHVVEPTLTISKTVSPASIQQYGTLLYTVDVVNTGSAGAFDIVITDVLPPSLQLGMVTMPGVCTNSSGGNTVSIYCPHLDALTMMQITYEALTLIPCPATVQNRATVTWTSLPGPGGTCASSLTLCTAGPSGAINGERNGSTVHPPYPLTSPPVPNNYWAGGSASLDVTCPPVAKLCIYKFEDRDGDGLYEPNAPDNEPLVPGWPFNVSPGIGNVTLPQGMWCFTVAPGTYTVNELPHPTNPAGWTLTTANPQTATILTQPVDLFFGNQRAPQCDLAIKKTTDPMPVVAGQQFAFVVKVTNVGTATCPGPTTVTDILPAAFTMSANGWYPQTTGGWVCNAPPNISCTNSQPLQPNVPSTVFIVAGTWAPGTTLLNCATIQQSPGDINPVNDSDCITLAPTPTPEPTPAGCLPCARVLLPITYNNRQHGATDTPSPGGTPLATETATPAPTPSASDVPSPTVLPPTVTVPTTATNTTTVTPSPPRPTTPALTATLTPTIRPTTTRTNTPVPTVPLTPTATSTLRPVSATSSPTAPPMGCAPLTTLPGLVAWWKLEGNQGEVIEDIIYRPMLNDGILFGWPFTWGQGQVGQALAFNGTTTYIDVPDDASLDFAASPAGDFSIDMWVKLPTTANTSGVRVLVAKQASSGGPGYQLYLYNAQPGIQLADSGGYTNINASQAIPKDNQWHLLVLSVDRDQATGGVFYLDGVQIGNAFDPTVRSGSLENAALLRIGAQSFQVGALFDGWLDEVEVFRSALSAAAVTRLYQAANVGKCTPTQPPPSLASAGPNWPSSWRPSAARSANLR